MGNCCSRSVRSSASAPVTIGDANGVTIRCRVLIPFHGLRIYDVHYFTGTGVQPRIDAGALVIV